MRIAIVFKVWYLCRGHELRAKERDKRELQLFVVSLASDIGEGSRSFLNDIGMRKFDELISYASRSLKITVVVLVGGEISESFRVLKLKKRKQILKINEERALFLLIADLLLLFFLLLSSLFFFPFPFLSEFQLGRSPGFVKEYKGWG